jgi:Copper amine oxidase N-terminal domain.
MKRIRFALLSAAVLLVSFGSGVIADDLYKTIKVSIKPVSIIVDDTGVVPSDRGGYFNNGENYVPATLQFAGTTYIPLRLAFEAVGYEVEWRDGVIRASREKRETASPLTFTFYDTPLLKRRTGQVLESEFLNFNEKSVRRFAGLQRYDVPPQAAFAWPALPPAPHDSFGGSSRSPISSSSLFRQAMAACAGFADADEAACGRSFIP